MKAADYIKKANLDDEDSYIKVIYSDKLSAAYTQASSDNFIQNTIVISTRYSSFVTTGLLAHECAHIEKGHMHADSDMLLKGLITKLTPACAKLADTKNQKLLTHHLCNIFEDFEINSEIFDKDEQLRMKTEIGGCFPSDVGYPDGMPWYKYALMALDNPEDFLRKMNDNKHDDNAESGKNKSGAGDNGDSEEQEAGNGESSEKAKSLEQLINEEINKAEEEAKAEEAEKAAGESAIKQSAPTGEAWADLNASGSKERTACYLAALKKLASFSERHTVKTDFFYNSRKGRTANGIIIPKRNRMQIHGKREMVIFLDVSGSQNTNELKSAMDAIVSVTSAKIHLITWDTRLEQEFEINKSTNMKSLNLRIGGGTTMTPGIKYAAEKYKKMDSFFIFSDFCDDDKAALKKALKSLKKKCTVNAVATSEMKDFEACDNFCTFDGKIIKH